MKKALKQLVSEERINALERIKRMEARLERVSNTVCEMCEIETAPENAEIHFSLLTQDNEIKN